MSVAATGVGTHVGTALADLAAVFGDRPYRPGMPACPHCVTDHDVLALGGDLDDIPIAVFARYSRKALTTWGEVPDLQRLLPRLLALVAAPVPGIDPTVVAGKLARALWTTWPTPERDAVAAFLEAWWAQGLDQRPGTAPPSVAVRLDSLAAASADLGPPLSEWHRRLSAEDPDVRLAAALHLAELLGGVAFDPDEHGSDRRLLGDPVGDAADQLFTWLAGSTTAIQLERAVYDFADTPAASRLATADARLARHRATRTIVAVPASDPS